MTLAQWPGERQGAFPVPGSDRTRPGTAAPLPATAVTSFTLLFGTPSSPEADKSPLRPLRFREIIEQAQPLSDPASPCSPIPLWYARQLAGQNANQEQVDSALILAVIFYESRLVPCAVSRSGAQGLMQLKPATANDIGVEDPFDPPGNVAGGTRYLRYLLDCYHGNTALALTAYKDGLRRVDRRRGRPASLGTQQYVDAILPLAGELAAD